jgi:hypothetical protein
MSNQLVLNASLAFAGNNITVAENVSNLQVVVTGNGLNSLTTFTATTSAVAVPLGSSTVAGGWLYLKNNDPTNYVQVLTAASSGTAFARLYPGEFCLFRLDAGITGPAVAAHTAGCSITVCIFDN